MAKPTTGRTWRVSLVVDGHDCGVWDQRTGGKQSSDTQTYMPGGMGPQIALPPGPPTIDVVTLERLFDGDRDGPLCATILLPSNAKGKVATVKQRPLDGDGTAYGSSFIWTGKLSGVNPPETDSTSGDPSKISIDITPDGPLGDELMSLLDQIKRQAQQKAKDAHLNLPIAEYPDPEVVARYRFVDPDEMKEIGARVRAKWESDEDRVLHAGTAYLVARGQVGEIRIEQPLGTETIPERRTERTWVKSSVRPVMYVTNPYSVKKLTGLAG